MKDDSPSNKSKLWQSENSDRTKYIDEVFSKVHPYYNIMNDCMSLGLHRIWKHEFIYLCSIKPTDQVLELACGSGDISLLLASRCDNKNTLTISDPNPAMLEQTKRRLLDHGHIDFKSIQCYAESIPLPDAHLHHVCISFGIRNATDRTKALYEIKRVLRPGGSLHILEFSHASWKLLNSIRSVWMKKCMMPLAEKFFHDRESYEYLLESIERHPSAPALSQELTSVGFTTVTHVALSGGLVALHHAKK
ncbi:MAG: ubiquinone/menaquinone biosynthesis methyltransferase [Methylacidiphilales bacterium]|nr:ubiquinone/menaquinone biosynthesis methyltransferase [Candidatus Methylacidiphilales bacterium]